MKMQVVHNGIEIKPETPQDHAFLAYQVGVENDGDRMSFTFTKDVKNGNPGRLASVNLEAHKRREAQPEDAAPLIGLEAGPEGDDLLQRYTEAAIGLWRLLNEVEEVGPDGGFSITDLANRRYRFLVLGADRTLGLPDSA